MPVFVSMTPQTDARREAKKALEAANAAKDELHRRVTELEEVLHVDTQSSALQRLHEAQAATLEKELRDALSKERRAMQLARDPDCVEQQTGTDDSHARKYEAEVQEAAAGIGTCMDLHADGTCPAYVSPAKQGTEDRQFECRCILYQTGIADGTSCA